MSRSYVCWGCRSRALGRQAARRFGNSATQTQNGRVRARYSGRELSPEQLLAQVEVEAEADRAEPTPRHGDGIQRHGIGIQRHDGGIQRHDGGGQRHEPGQRPPRYQADSVLDPELKRYAAVLREHVAAGNVDGAWHALRDIGKGCAQRQIREFRPLFAKEHRLLPALSWLVVACNENWIQGLRRNDVSPHAPTPYHFLQVLHALNNTSAHFYRPTLWHLADALSHIRFSHAGEDCPALRHGREELVKVWRLCMGAHLTRIAVGGQITEENRAQFAAVALRHDDWSFLPPMRTFAAWTADRRSPDVFASRLNTLVPLSRSVEDAREVDARKHDYASPAIATWDLLQLLPPALFGDSPLYTPLTTLFGTLFKHAGAPYVPICLKDAMRRTRDAAILEGYRSMLDRVNCQDLPSVMRAINTAKPVEGRSTNETREQPSDDASDAAAPPTRPPLDPKMTFAIQPQNPATERFAITQITRLGTAQERDDRHTLEAVKGEIMKFAESQTSVQDRLPLEVYEHFMLAALSMRNFKLAMEVWHLLPQLGYKPTLKTHTVMLRGAQNARDVRGMDAFWQNMQQNGFQPDAHAWSIRILGLLKLRSPNAGLEAMHQMGQQWFNAAMAKERKDKPVVKSNRQQPASTVSPAELLKKYPGPIDGVSRPTLEVMNATIAGLSTVKPAEIPKAFAWGRSFGIEPDLYTYNALLTLAMRNQQTHGALDIVRQMQRRGIQADSTTWTVLLAGLFENGFLDNLSHAEQQVKILNLIDAFNDKELGLAGIDEKGYALIMDRLLKRYTNHMAASAVFNHMLASGREPSPHIYTIIMTSHFQRQPEPDFAAIENLWRNIITDRNGTGFSAALDTTFYDRMIEGYASWHHIVGTKKMEEMYARSRSEGKQPGWMAVHAMARVYAARELWNKLRALIDEIRIAQRDNSGRFARRGEDHFWSFIEGTGILQDMADGHRRKRESQSRILTSLVQQRQQQQQQQQ